MEEASGEETLAAGAHQIDQSQPDGTLILNKLPEPEQEKMIVHN